MRTTRRLPRQIHRRVGRAAASLDAALVGAGPEVAAPPLARLGRQLQGADLGPHDSFRADLRAQLMAAATVAAPAQSRQRVTSIAASGHSIGWFATRLTAGIAAAGVMVTGVGVASARALPGDALYGVKRDAESVQLNLASGDTARGVLHLQFAASRLSEVHGLLSRAGLTTAKHSKHTSAVAVPRALAAALRSTLSAMNEDTSTGASELTQSFLAKRQQAPLAKLAAFTTQQETALTLVLPALPAPEAAASLHVLHAVAAQTTALLAEPVSPPPATPAASPAASPSTTPSPVASSPTPSPSPTDTPSPTATAGSPTPTVEPTSATPAPSSTPPAPSVEPKSPTDSPVSTPPPSSDSPSPSPSPSTKPSAKPSSSPSASASAASPTPSATVTP